MRSFVYCALPGKVLFGFVQYDDFGRVIHEENIKAE
jgi:hypothetical protein